MKDSRAVYPHLYGAEGITSPGPSFSEPAVEPAVESAVEPDARWEPWKAALSVFVLSRVLILFVSYLALRSFGTGTRHLPTLADPHGSPWFQWDATLFTQIAAHGYSTQGHSALTVAFFPLWPLLTHLAGSPFGPTLGVYYAAGLVLANLCFYFALVLLYLLLRADFDIAVARRGILYLAFYPFALYFFAGYSESLFVLLVVATFLALRRGTTASWWLAGVLGFLAALTRAVGVVLVVPFVVLAAQRCWLASDPVRVRLWRMARMLAPAALIPLGIVAYMGYLGHIAGNPLFFQQMEVRNWGRHLALPWEGIVGALQGLGSRVSTLNVVDLIFLLLPLAILMLGWKRLPPHYSLFAAALALVTLCEPLRAVEPLASAPRYMMVIFPIVVICAIWGRDARFDRWYMAISTGTLALMVALFVSHHWVA